MKDFLDYFFKELKREELDDGFIDSLKNLIASDEFSEENIIELIEGVYNE